MKAYFAIKFHENGQNKKLIEKISDSLQEAEIEPIILIRDYENWGKIKLKPQELMKLAFKLIDESDLIIIEFSEKGVGLGIEAGYAHAKNKPIIIIAKEDSEISNTIKGIAKSVIFYDDPDELIEKFKEVNRNNFKI